MKRLHREDLYGWSEFNPDRNIDFHSVLWARPGGSIVVDPLPMSDHDRAHLLSFGPVSIVVVTNSDHLREAAGLSELTGADIFGPSGERDRFPVSCQRWLAEGDEIVSGLHAMEMHGSKTPGELALLLEESTLITGDLIRSHEGGRLCMLPRPKLSDPRAAAESVMRIAGLAAVDAVLVGDGWPVFRHGAEALDELARSLSAA